jgi:hypothetical protein
MIILQFVLVITRKTNQKGETKVHIWSVVYHYQKQLYKSEYPLK